MTYDPLSPFRAAPLIEPEAPAKPFPTARFLAGVVAVLLLNGHREIVAALVQRRQQRAQESARQVARAEQNARAWVRSAYGVDPWVRCGGSEADVLRCDVVVNRGVPFALACDTTSGGACRLGSAR